MKRLLLALVALAPACSSAPRQEYERGAVTPFARDAIAAAGAEAPQVLPEEPGTVPESVDRLAAEWRAKARAEPAGPAAFGLTAPASATEDDLRKELTLGVVLGAAWRMSPAIAAERERLRATVEQFDQVAYLDTILRQYSAFTRDLDLRVGPPLQKERLDAYYPFPGTVALKSGIVAEDAKAATARLDATTRRTLVAAGRSYYEIAYLGEAIGIVTENEELLRGIVGVAESKYGTGTAKQSVVLRAHLEISALDDQLVTLREKLATERSRLASILGLPAEFPLGEAASVEAVPPPAAPAPLYEKAKRDRQEIVALRAKIARAGLLIELAETKTYPSDARPMPRPWFGSAASFIEEMKGRLASMRSDLAELEARTEYEVKNAWFRWDAAWRQAELHRTSLLPQAEQAFRVIEAGWQEGVADFLDALDAERSWLRFRLAYREAVRETGSGRLGLIDAVGSAVPAGEGGK